MPSAARPPLPAAIAAEVQATCADLAARPELAPLLGPGAPLAADASHVVAGSPYVGEVLGRYPGLLPALVADNRLATPLDAAALARDAAAACGGSEAATLAGLRRLRHRELVRIVWRDLCGLAGVAETLADLSALADALIIAALADAEATLKGRFGTPRDADGAESRPAVIAMGKLGGRELNFSSDVDLVFAYAEGGETDGPRPTDNAEYFRLLAQRVIDLLARQTGDGFVYRVDTRLRPFGNAGPLAVSLAGLEAYFVQHGRDWERYAWVKARVINDWPETAALERDVLRPFVYRRYLDYGVFASLREMKAMIEAEVERREFHANLKLGPGGIREIEFIAQALQLVRGGSIAPLRSRELKAVLPQLARHGCLPAGVVADLDRAYDVLRLAENRIQAQHDRQTHELPDDEPGRARLALAMGHAGWEDCVAAIDAGRAVVAGHFKAIAFRTGAREGGDDGDAAASGAARAWQLAAGGGEVAPALAAGGFTAAEEAAEVLRRLLESPAIRRLDEHGRQRLDQLMPAALATAARDAEPLRALAGLAQVLEAIGRRSAYFALLNENPAALERLVRLCGQSRFLSDQVAAHPLLLDELLDPLVFTTAPTRADFAADLAARLERAGTDDAEARLDALRNFQQAALFRVALVDLSGVLPLMKVSDRLTDIAELVLEAAIGLATGELTARHGEPACDDGAGPRPARFAIVGYGKLGGLELGYGSDLDLVFLHDSAGSGQQTAGPDVVDNATFFSRLVRRIISILTMHTTTGKLYEVDIRLRPSGRSGLMVSSLAAFEQYQRDDAWTWEHQALLRARAVAGDPGVRAAFEALRTQALCQYVRRDDLRREVADMRARMRAELAAGTPELLDLKQDEGGITDIEFLVQYLVLRDAARFPDLLRWSDNIRQLEALAAHGGLPAAEAEALADAYRRYRHRIHRQNLAGEPALAPRAEFADLVALVTAAWHRVFDAAL
jgi:glutamate-ammonia-ligase adenylyltransferase